VNLRVQDYYPSGKRFLLRFKEKGGKEKELPVHHKLEELLDEYLKATGLDNEPGSPLFPAALGKTGKLSRRPLVRTDAADMLKRRLPKLNCRLPQLLQLKSSKTVLINMSGSTSFTRCAENQLFKPFAFLDLDLLFRGFWRLAYRIYIRSGVAAPQIGSALKLASSPVLRSC
jgi:hypothetical protein